MPEIECLFVGGPLDGQRRVLDPARETINALDPPGGPDFKSIKDFGKYAALNRWTYYRHEIWVNDPDGRNQQFVIYVLEHESLIAAFQKLIDRYARHSGR